MLYLSRYIIAHRADYYRLLLKVTTDAAWEEWILYVLRAVRETANSTTAKISSIRDLLAETTERVRRDAPRIYSRELVELIFVQPYCRIGNVVDEGIACRQSASANLKRLCEGLEERKAGRERLFTHPALLRVLTEKDA